MRKLVLFVFFGLASISAFADSSLNGTWQGMNYSIKIDNDFNYVRGYWGNVSYDLRVDGTFNYVRGSSNGHSIDIKVDPNFKYARGTLPCGTIDLRYDETFTYIRGTLCGSGLEEKLSDPYETRETFKALVLDELIADFPTPTSEAVKSFISKTVRF